MLCFGPCQGNHATKFPSFTRLTDSSQSYDSPFHLAEECTNANVASPRAIIITGVTGGVLGWFLQLVVAYTVTDVSGVLNSDLGQPWASYLLQVLPAKSAQALLGLTICAGFFMGQGCMIAASRVTFAYARDGCFPGSKYWKQVNQTTKTPVNAVWFTTSLGILLLLLIFAGEVAIGAIFSAGGLAAYVAFSTPIAFRVFFVRDKFRPGPYSMGKYSVYVGFVGVVFVWLMIPILCLPSVTGADLE